MAKQYWLFKLHPLFDGSNATSIRCTRSAFHKVQRQHFRVRGRQGQKPLRKISFLCQKSLPIGWYLAVAPVLFFSRPRSDGWPRHGRTFSIYPCPLSFWLTLPWGVLSTSWCCPSRPRVAFLACVHLALFWHIRLSCLKIQSGRSFWGHGVVARWDVYNIARAEARRAVRSRRRSQLWIYSITGCDQALTATRLVNGRWQLFSTRPTESTSLDRS